MKRIKLLPSDLRPREKLLKSGAEILNLEELLATILITGNHKKPLSLISKRIASLIKENKISKENLLDIGIGRSKTAQILAVVELSKRLNENKKNIFKNYDQIIALCQDFANQEKENLVCFYLNGRKEIIKQEILAVGSLNKVNLLPREIFCLIKDLPVAAIILVHNHPSGSLEPSENDINFTYRVKLVGEILGVELIAHLIVSKEGWTKLKI